MLRAGRDPHGAVGGHDVADARRVGMLARVMTRYMVMHKVDAQMESGAPPPAGVIEKMGQYVGDAIAKGIFKDGAGLHGSKRRTRLERRGGKTTVTPGPYAGGNELLAGFTMIEADGPEHALEIARGLADANGNDIEFEIGAVVEPWDLGLAAKPEGVPQRFLLLRKADAAYEAETAPPIAPALARAIAALDRAQSDASLRPSKHGARLTAKGSWVDGPFAEARELVGGFSIIDVPSLADAKAWTEAYQRILGETEVDVREVA